MYIYNLGLSIALNDAITISAISFTYYDNSQIYSSIIDEFNKYSVEKNLNITLNLQLYTPMNSTIYTDDYGSVVESFLKKKKENTYDIFFYNNIYSPRFGKYFYDLKEILPKEHIDMYDPFVLSQSCSYGNKIVGLVNIYIFILSII